jgi:hypothetical protein
VKQFRTTYASVGRSVERQLTEAALHPNVRQFIQAERKRLK